MIILGKVIHNLAIKIRNAQGYDFGNNHQKHRKDKANFQRHMLTRPQIGQEL